MRLMFYLEGVWCLWLQPQISLTITICGHWMIFLGNTSLTVVAIYMHSLYMGIVKRIAQCNQMLAPMHYISSHQVCLWCTKSTNHHAASDYSYCLLLGSHLGEDSTAFLLMKTSTWLQSVFPTSINVLVGRLAWCLNMDIRVSPIMYISVFVKVILSLIFTVLESLCRPVRETIDKILECVSRIIISKNILY